MSTHVHDWKRQPQHSYARFDRLQCTTCEAWGHRWVDATRRKLGPIVPYVKGWTPPPPPITAQPMPEREHDERHFDRLRRREEHS